MCEEFSVDEEDGEREEQEPKAVWCVANPRTVKLRGCDTPAQAVQALQRLLRNRGEPLEVEEFDEEAPEIRLVTCQDFFPLHIMVRAEESLTTRGVFHGTLQDLRGTDAVTFVRFCKEVEAAAADGGDGPTDDDFDCFDDPLAPRGGPARGWPHILRPICVEALTAPSTLDRAGSFQLLARWVFPLVRAIRAAAVTPGAAELLRQLVEAAGVPCFGWALLQKEWEITIDLVREDPANSAQPAQVRNTD